MFLYSRWFYFMIYVFLWKSFGLQKEVILQNSVFGWFKLMIYIHS